MITVALSLSNPNFIVLADKIWVVVFSDNRAYLMRMG